MSRIRRGLIPTPDEDAAYQELRAEPAVFRWVAHGGKGHTVSAVHPRHPYIGFQICITNDRALSQHIADAHNAQLEGETK